MESEKITVREASEILGISQGAIRYGLQHKTLPIGYARKSRGHTYRYDVYKNLVMSYAGLAEWPQKR